MSVESPDTHKTTVIPVENIEFSEVFSNAKANHPLHWPLNISQIMHLPMQITPCHVQRLRLWKTILKKHSIRLYPSLYILSSDRVFLCGEKKMAG